MTTNNGFINEIVRGCETGHEGIFSMDEYRAACLETWGDEKRRELADENDVEPDDISDDQVFARITEDDEAGNPKYEIYTLNEELTSLINADMCIAIYENEKNAVAVGQYDNGSMFEKEFFCETFISNVREQITDYIDEING